MKKRLIATLLAGVMALTMLAGCGQKQTEGSKENNSSTVKTEESKSSEVKKEEPQEVQKVTWYSYGTEAADHALVMEDLNKKLKEKINVELELIVIPAGEYDEKMKLNSTSGDKYEIAWTSNWRNSFSGNMARGAFMPIDDLLAEYGQGILENCPDWLLDMGKVGGVQYAIPNLQIVASQYSIYIQKKYADEYGWDKESLDSFEEIYPFLDWIKENYPDMVPLSFDGIVNYPVEYESISGVVYLDVENPDTVVPITEVDAEDEKLKRYLLDQGYIREDIATVTDANGDRNTGRYACIWAAGKPGGEVTNSIAWKDEYIQVPVGTQGYISSTAGHSTMNAFNVNADNPEAAMKLLNLLWTDKEIFNELLWGIENVHYKKIDDNRIEPVADSQYNYGGSAWKYGNQFDAWVIPGQDDDVWEVTEAFNNAAIPSPIAGFVADLSDYQTELTQINSVQAEYKLGCYTCDDVDAFLAERNAKFEAAGLQKVVDAVQEQLDAWRKANNK